MVTGAVIVIIHAIIGVPLAFCHMRCILFNRNYVLSKLRSVRYAMDSLRAARALPPPCSACRRGGCRGGLELLIGVSGRFDL
jgi:hypothetical protein